MPHLLKWNLKSMDTNELAHILEAILFVAGGPVSTEDLRHSLGATEAELNQAADRLEMDYDQHRRGICLRRFGFHLQLATRADYAPYVVNLLQPVQKQSLSQSAMETLAVVAYRQPVTRLEIEAIRGVKCDYSIQSLLNKDLIQAVGRKEALGRPVLYGTTDHFLSHFGLSSLNDLPAPPESAPETQEEPLVP